MCPAKQKVAFLYALGAACGPKMPPQAVFQSYGQLEEFAWSEARENPVFRSASENIVWLWTYLFMLVTADNDLSRLRGSRNNTLAKDRLIKMAVDLGRFAIKHFKQEIPPESEGLAISVVLIARQAWNCVGILARLHAIGTATDDDIPLTGVESVGSARDCELLSEEASFLSRKSFMSIDIISVHAFHKFHAPSRNGESTGLASSLGPRASAGPLCFTLIAELYGISRSYKECC